MGHEVGSRGFWFLSGVFVVASGAGTAACSSNDATPADTDNGATGGATSSGGSSSTGGTANANGSGGAGGEDATGSPWDGHLPGTVEEASIDSDAGRFRLVRVVDGLSNPWALAFVPGGLLVTERPGRMQRIGADGMTEVSGVPGVATESQGGLLDVALHPSFHENRWIYFTYSASEAGGNGTRLARASLSGTELTDVEVLYPKPPETTGGAGYYGPGGAHFGSRIAFLPDGTLLMTLGDRGADPNNPGSHPAQDGMRAYGSTLRLADDGSVPGDNPWVDLDGYLPELFTMGNRNSQGMTVHPETGAVFQSEHGPNGGDELNVIVAGANYGWPLATEGNNYGSQTPIGQPHSELPEFEAPITWWGPPPSGDGRIAPSGLTFYTGDRLPGWQGNLFIASLVSRRLVRLTMSAATVTGQEDLLVERIGRIRDVRQSPDGYLYLINDEAEGAAVFRLEPVE